MSVEVLHMLNSKFLSTRPSILQLFVIVTCMLMHPVAFSVDASP